MIGFFNYPVLIFFVSFLLLWLSAWGGMMLRGQWQGLAENMREDYAVVLGGTLTLLGLIIGFSFSMATTRYDQRKTYEEAEANAIGTEYVRADLLPRDDALQARALLVRYTVLRIRFYKTRDLDELKQIDGETAALQSQLWKVAATAATAQPNTNTMLATSGMNDVLNSQGYTQAAWWNRIPVAAWAMMVAIAVVAHVLLGYGSHLKSGLLPVVLPLMVAISFFLIADIDSPRGGIVRVRPQNLIVLANSLGGPYR